MVTGKRLYRARKNLSDLLRVYGDYPIIVKVTMEGEEVQVLAKSFVKRQLSKVGLMFPYTAPNKNNTRPINKQLDIDQLSVIFHEAVFEYEEAYIETNCLGDPQAEGYINSIYTWINRKRQWLDCTFQHYEDDELVPFMEERKSLDLMTEGAIAAREAFKSYGIRKVDSMKDTNRLFMEMALQHEPITKEQKKHILNLIVDSDVSKAFIEAVDKYNHLLQYKVDNKQIHTEEEENKVKIKALNIEVTELKKKYKDDVAELKEEVAKLKKRNKAYEKSYKRIRTLLGNPRDVMFNFYDLTKESDIREYLSWYQVSNRKVKNQTIKVLEKFRYPDNPEALDLFKRMVEEYNATLLDDGDDKDGEEESTE